MSYSVTVNDVTYGVLLPDNSTSLEVALASIDAWRIGSLDVDVIRRIHRPDDCPPAFLPLLAWEYSVDEWDPAWTVAVKRNAIKQSLEVHRHKGTAYAVETAIQALDLGAVVEEWFEYGGTAYRFRLTIDLGQTEEWTGKRADSLARVGLRTKNVRSRLETIRVRRVTNNQGPFIGGFMRSSTAVRIAPIVPRELQARPYLYVAAFVHSKQAIRLQPSE